MPHASETSAIRDPLFWPATPNAPLACDMTGATDTMAERFAEYGRLFPHALVGRERLANAVELVFAAKPGVGDWVADLARREAACCPFMSHRVSFDAAHVTWRWSSDAGSAVDACLDELYALPERIDGGLNGMLQRLGQQGMAVDSASPLRLEFGQSDAIGGARTSTKR